MIFTLRTEVAAGALFGSVRNNVQLNRSSIDGVVIGEKETSGTLFASVASSNRIQVIMIDSRYCILGNVKDTCMLDTDFKEPDALFDPTADESSLETRSSPLNSIKKKKEQGTGRKEKLDPCCDEVPETLEEYEEGQCVFFVSATSARQDCSCDGFGNCGTEVVEHECMVVMDLSSAFEDDERKE